MAGKNKGQRRAALQALSAKRGEIPFSSLDPKAKDMLARPLAELEKAATGKVQKASKAAG